MHRRNGERRKEGRKGQKKEGQKGGKKEDTTFWFISQISINDQGWARIEEGVGNSIQFPYLGSRNLTTLAITFASQDLL